jgi:hypothetical protein
MLKFSGEWVFAGGFAEAAMKVWDAVKNEI